MNTNKQVEKLLEALDKGLASSMTVRTQHGDDDDYMSGVYTYLNSKGIDYTMDTECPDGYASGVSFQRFNWKIFVGWHYEGAVEETSSLLVKIE